MDRKTEKSVLNESLGFEVEVKQAPMRRMRGEWVLDVGPRCFQRTVLWKLLVSPTPLSGEHVRFLRLALEKTMEALAARLGVSAAAVSKWEDKQGEPTQMNKGTEVLLRMFAAETLLEQSDLPETKRNSTFYHVYKQASQFSRQEDPPSILVTRDERRRAKNNAANVPYDIGGSLLIHGLAGGLEASEFEDLLTSLVSRAASGEASSTSGRERSLQVYAKNAEERSADIARALKDDAA